MFIRINFQNKTKTILIAILIALVIIAALVIIYQRYFKKDRKLSTVNPFKAILKEEEKKIPNPLDGSLSPESTATRHPLAIMVENHPEARPQFGLNKASLVYEAITEGGITRFIAIFGPHNASKVGPVRSARSFFLDWILEYNAFYAHVGGSREAKALIPQLGILDLDQFRYGTRAYWREPKAGVATEHTMFTDTEKLYKIAQDNKWDLTANFEKLEFKNDATEIERPTNQTVTVDFSSPTYKVVWKYEPKENVYLRELAGLSHKDGKTGEQLKFKNIIAQTIERSIITEDEQQVWYMKTTGQGKARIFLDGKEIKGTWKKPSQKERTKFFNENDQEIEFNKGPFWIEIVPPDSTVSVS